MHAGRDPPAVKDGPQTPRHLGGCEPSTEPEGRRDEHQLAPASPRTGVRAVGIVGGRPVYPIKGGAPTLLEQRDEVARLLADDSYDGDVDELLQRADDIAAKIEQANQRDARLRSLRSASPLLPVTRSPTPGSSRACSPTTRASSTR